MRKKEYKYVDWPRADCIYEYLPIWHSFEMKLATGNEIALQTTIGIRIRDRTAGQVSSACSDAAIPFFFDNCGVASVLATAGATRRSRPQGQRQTADI